MKKIVLENDISYDLAVEGLFDMGNGEISITIIPKEKSFSDIESEFSNESNTKILKIVGENSNVIDIKRDYTVLDSIEKKNNYIVQSSMKISENGNMFIQDIRGTAYIITLSKPDLYEQVNKLQETVNMLSKRMEE